MNFNQTNLSQLFCRQELEERKAYKEQVEGPAKEAKEAAKAEQEKREAEKKEAEKEKTKAAAELELGRIDKDTDGVISPDEVNNLCYHTVSFEDGFQ